MRPTDVPETCADLTYPLTKSELMEAVGETTVDLAGGQADLGAVLARAGYEEYDSPEDVETAVLTGVGADAVGRRYYSDRDAPAMSENSDQVSF